MKKSHLLGAALVAVFAFSAVAAVSASALETLLAEWLVGGAVLTTELASTTTGELLLEDNKAPLVGNAGVVCSGILDGTVGPNSQDLINEALTLAGALVGSLTSGTRLTCTNELNCSSPILVNPVGLPWQTEAELLIDGAETFFVDLLKKVGGGTLGWEVECTILGVKVVDECTTTEGVAKLTLNGAELLGEFTAAFTALAGLKNANCTQGGAESGVVEGSGKIAADAEPLSVSSEGSEA